MMEKVEIKEPIAGFTERDVHSKALLNTDMNNLLKYKLQRQRTLSINNRTKDLESVQNQILDLKSELTEIKELLLRVIHDNR